MNRTCSTCKTEKPLSQFVKNKRCTDGRTFSCQSCRNVYQNKYADDHRERLQEYHHQYYLESKGPGYVPRRLRAKRTPEEISAARAKRKLADRAATIRKQYGVTMEWYEEQFRKQNGRCSICQREPERMFSFAVDHDHKTGKVRELLCSGCNTSLGRMNDDPALLCAAAAYLERHQ